MSMTSHWFCEECQWHPSTQKFFPGWFCDECQWRRADFVRNANDIRHKKYHSRAVLWWMSMTSGWFCEECQWHPSQKILRGWFADECQWRLADFVRNANDIRHKKYHSRVVSWWMSMTSGWFCEMPLTSVTKKNNSRAVLWWMSMTSGWFCEECQRHSSQQKLFPGWFCDERKWLSSENLLLQGTFQGLYLWWMPRLSSQNAVAMNVELVPWTSCGRMAGPGCFSNMILWWMPMTSVTKLTSDFDADFVMNAIGIHHKMQLRFNKKIPLGRFIGEPHGWYGFEAAFCDECQWHSSQNPHRNLKSVLWPTSLAFITKSCSKSTLALPFSRKMSKGQVLHSLQLHFVMKVIGIHHKSSPWKVPCSNTFLTTVICIHHKTTLGRVFVVTNVVGIPHKIS